MKTSKQGCAGRELGLERKIERDWRERWREKVILKKEKLSDVPGCKRNLILQVMTSSTEPWGFQSWMLAFLSLKRLLCAQLASAFQPQEHIKAEETD